METPIARGALVEKVNAKPEDTHRNGARGRIQQQIGPATEESSAPGTWGYWVEFEKPLARVFVAGTRLKPIND
jgi:uncharacterized protein YllA (UPF0747 family)